MEAVSLEVAEQEVQAWIEKCRFRKRKVESNKEYVDQLIEGVIHGDLSIDEETHDIEMELIRPVGDVRKLVFKTELKVKEIRHKLKSGNVSAGDSDGRILAYISALTNQPFSVIDDLNTEDQSLASSIAIFFF